MYISPCLSPMTQVQAPDPPSMQPRLFALDSMIAGQFHQDVLGLQFFPEQPAQRETCGPRRSKRPFGLPCQLMAESCWARNEYEAGLTILVGAMAACG